jgi:hypothetical protein
MNFMARPEPTVAPGSIAFNLIQRKTLTLGLNEPLAVSVWFPPSDNIHLTRMSVEVDFAVKKQVCLNYTKDCDFVWCIRVQVQDPIDAEALGKHVANMFKSHVFAIGQDVLIDFSGHNLTLRVTELEVKKGTGALTAEGHKDLKEGDVSAAPYGMLGQYTLVMVPCLPTFLAVLFPQRHIRSLRRFMLQYSIIIDSARLA